MPSPPSGVSLSLLNVQKCYDSVEAVRDLTLEVRAGEFLSLLGPSGSGKTTILMMIAGFEMPDRGAILMGGRDVTDVPANRRNVGMVFQRYALFPHMTVAENIAFPLKMRRSPRHEVARRVEETLALVRLEGLGERLPGQLSGGQQQRVALARAIVFGPPVLLMDEPLGALDKKLRHAMQLELKRLQQRLGSTVIYVTHDQEEALTMSDRIAVLNRGGLEQLGRPEDLYETPANAFVADFVGDTNFLAAEVIELDKDRGMCTLRIGPTMVAGAKAASGVAQGGLVRIAVRPERVRLLSNGDGLAGTVTERIYAGAMIDHVVRLGLDLEVIARLPAGTDSATWDVGQQVGLSWDAGDARAYPAGTS